MSRWKERKLGDLLRIKHGYAFAGEHIVTDDNGKVLVTPGNFAIGGGWKPSYKKFYDGEFPDDYILREGDLVVTMTDLSKDVDTLGFSAKVPKDSRRAFLHNQRIGLVTDIADEAEPDFLYWVMRTAEYRASIVGTASGSTVSHTSPTRIYEYVFDCPEPDEQRAIASVLSSLDAKIDLLHRQNKTLEGMAEALFREWFVEEAEEGWEEGTLGDILSVQGGTTPSTKNPAFWDGEFCWTTPRDLSGDQSLYLFDTARKITAEGLEQIGSGLLAVGTLLLSSRAPVGYMAFASVPVAINQGYIAITGNEGYSNRFIYLWLKANMETVKGHANGSTFQEISKSDFKTIEIIIPPKERVEEFDQVVESLFDKVKSNQIQTQSLTKLRDTLLPKLMSGEVRVEN